MNLLKNLKVSELVFLLVTLTACVAFGLGKLDSKDFMVLAMAAFSFYFSYKGEVKNTPAPTTDLPSDNVSETLGGAAGK